jgi:hypothetical protein
MNKDPNFIKGKPRTNDIAKLSGCLFKIPKTYNLEDFNKLLNNSGNVIKQNIKDVFNKDISFSDIIIESFDDNESINIKLFYKGE